MHNVVQLQLTVVLGGTKANSDNYNLEQLPWNLHLHVQPPLYKGYFPLSPRGPLWRGSPVLNMSYKHYIFNIYLTGPLIPDPSLLFQSMV